jgi:predicted AlkP superfamily phosphohydrolase/phosphomutase
MYKLVILGFDGFDSRIFERSNDPVLSKVREISQWGTLYSEEMRTAPCWTSILTGWEIETHGIKHLLGYPVDGQNWFCNRPKDYIFDELNRSGYSVGIANFPSMLFSRKIEGWMISGWPNQPHTYPNTICLPKDLYSDFPDYEARVLDYRKPKGALQDWSIHEIPFNEYMEWVLQNAFRRIGVIESLPKTDILMIQESVLDRAGHMLSTPNKGKLGTDDPRYKCALQLVSSIIEYIYENYQFEYLSIVSDHGFQGLSEANPQHGCWHSTRGLWTLSGSDVLIARNDFPQVDYMPTILDSVNISVSREGKSRLLLETRIKRQLAGLGYL